jgi:SpoVK/Ycf46/Vps4 family AAA+-type ATPase
MWKGVKGVETDIVSKLSNLGNYFSKTVEDERRYPKLLTPILFFIMASVSLVFIPFYPAWMALIFAVVIGLVSYRFPFLSIIILCVFITAAAAHQTPEFGLFMLLFMLAVLVISLFEWRLGFLVLFTISLSRFGLSLAVPIIAATLLPFLVSITAVVLSGVFLWFLVTCGNLNVAGMFVGSVHSSSFMVFYEPVAGGFTPADVGTALMSIQDADIDVMGQVIGENFGISVAPLLQIILWGLAVYLVFRFYHRESSGTGFPALMAFIPSVVMVISFFGAYSFELNEGGAGMIAGVLLFGVVFVSVLIGRVAKEFFTPYFASLDIESGVGTRISDMEDLGETSFELIGGLDDVKEDVKESIVVPLLMSDVAARYGIEPPKGILLFGPPGCGKTLLMKALANELKVEMLTVKCSDIMSKWYGESEGKVAELFRVAKDRKPCIIFFDDLEAMAKHRDLYAGDDVTPRLLSIILAELDGMDRSSGIILVGTTNKPEMIDPALLRPGRFDKVIYVPPPDVLERISILKVHLASRPLARNINLKLIAAKCERFSGADLANLAREGATLAMRRALESGKDTVITNEDLNTVATTIRPSITLAMLENYELLKLDFERKMHHVRREDSRWAVGWGDVGGMDRLKKDIREYIELLIKEPKVLEDFRLKTGRGMLLFGPPGCGKKHVMRAAANDLGVPIQELSAAELVGGPTDTAPPIKEIFYRARESTPSIILISDVDVIGSKEAIESKSASQAISQILAEIDDVEAREHILVIATTNRPQTLHPSLLRPGRFDKMFYVPPPDKKARAKIFDIYLRNIPRAKDVDTAFLTALADKTDGFSSADIAAIVDEAKLMAVINCEDAARRAVSRIDLMNALKRVEGSISLEDLDSSTTFMKTYKVRD